MDAVYHTTVTATAFRTWLIRILVRILIRSFRWNAVGLLSSLSVRLILSGGGWRATWG